jgi:ParB-like chromosome segregation protein Spo0J
MNVELIKTEISKLRDLNLDDQVKALNDLKLALHDVSPFKNEPVDCVIWAKSDLVHANDYNPNSVAPPEMKLLEHSILEDGYTQPIVTWPHDEKLEVVDGFHRNRVGKESKEVLSRVKGYLPVVVIRDSQAGVGDRMASTVRHNRARGKHRVEAMSEIVVELKRRNWSDSKIAKNLGMDEDEVLRLCQITGMAELFADADFSKSWDIGFEGEGEEIVEFEEPQDGEE